MNLEPLSVSERDLIKQSIHIMSKANPSDDELSFLMNRCGPGAEVAKKVFRFEVEAIAFADPSKRKDTLAHLEVIMTVISQLSLIAGGIGLADFSKVSAIERNFKAVG